MSVCSLATFIASLLCIACLLTVVLFLYLPIVHLTPFLYYWLEPVSKHFTVVFGARDNIWFDLKKCKTNRNIFEILQSSHPLPWWKCSPPLVIPSISFTWNAFPTVLKEFPHMLSTCWLRFLQSAVQLTPNHLNWVEVGWLWRPGHLMQHSSTLLGQIALTQPGGVFWVIVLLKKQLLSH